MNMPMYDHLSNHQLTTPEDGAILHYYAKLLGYSGLIPFVSLSSLFLLLQGDLQEQIGRALVTYGAVIVSFLAAYHWATAIAGVNAVNAHRRMVYSVLLVLLAWLATLLPLVFAFGLIICSLLVAYLADSRWGTTPVRYLALRRHLSIIATLSLVMAVVKSMEFI